MKIAPILLIVFALAACTQGYQYALLPNVAAGLRLEGIEVDASHADFTWGAAARAYAASIGKPNEAVSLASTPQARAYMGAMADKSIKAAFEKAFAGRLEQGQKKVWIDVTVRKITLASVLQRIVFGGNYDMTADVDLVDASSGQVIMPNHGLSTRMLAGNGIAGAMIDPLFGKPVDRLAANLAKSYRNWLLPNPGEGLAARPGQAGQSHV
ncbi:MAG TPA: hypothetical protein VND97_07910 [Beijerinckiaceae bacterium]|nr:hypothetical protein [Beijerinckiaceae bacterium]